MTMKTKEMLNACYLLGTYFIRYL